MTLRNVKKLTCVIFAVLAASFVIGQTVPPAYSSTATYAVGDIVTGSDGNVYRAIAAGTALDDPTTDAYVDWELQWVNYSLTLNVANSGSRFSSIQGAMNFIQDAFIASNCFVTIKVADGTYGTFTTPINLDHPCGGQIELIGDTASPSSCKIQFGPSGGFYKNGLVVTNGNDFYFIDGFTVDGGSNLLSNNTSGILCQLGSHVGVGTHMVVSNFSYGYAAEFGGEIYFSTTSSSASSATSCYAGYVAGYGGTLTAWYESASNCTYGFESLEGSRLNAFNCTANTSIQNFGFYAHNASFLLDINGTGMTSATSTDYSIVATGY